MIRRLALFLFLLQFGCMRAPEVEWMMRGEKAPRVSTSAIISNNVFELEMWATVPATTMLMAKPDVKEQAKENIVDGAKEIGLALINALGTITEPWVAAIPIVGYVSSAIVQKVGDTSFIHYKLRIPLNGVASLEVIFDTSAGRKDLKYIKVTRHRE